MCRGIPSVLYWQRVKNHKCLDEAASDGKEPEGIGNTKEAYEKRGASQCELCRRDWYCTQLVSHNPLFRGSMEESRVSKRRRARQFSSPHHLFFF